MCYTSRDSIISYFINISSCLALYKYAKSKEMTLIAIFFLFVGQMQLFDYIFWKNQSCNFINTITTKIAIVFNHFQPIILFLLLYYFGIKQSGFTESIFYLYLVIGLIYTLNMFNEVSCTLKNGDNVLDWQWNKGVGSTTTYALFLAYLTMASLSLPSPFLKYLLAFCNIFTFYISTKTSIFSKTVGRIWCYYASLLPVLFLILNFLIY